MHEYIESIFTTENIIKKNNFAYIKYLENFAKNPIIAFENDPESTELGTEFLYNKGILSLSCLFKEKKIEKSMFIDFCEYLAMTFVYN